MLINKKLFINKKQFINKELCMIREQCIKNLYILRRLIMRSPSPAQFLSFAFLFALSGTEDSCTLQIGGLSPAPGLSPAGELRALNFLFDSLDQLIENELHALSRRKDEERRFK